MRQSGARFFKLSAKPLLICALALALCGPEEARVVAPPAEASEPSLALPQPVAADSALPAVTVALIGTVPGASESALYFARLGDTGVTPELEWDHLPGGSVRAEVIPGSDIVVATAPVTPSRDRSFDGGLWELTPGVGAELLCHRVYHASRPLVTAEGRVFVSRGSPGPPPQGTPLELRIDSLTIDEVELGSGATRTVLSYVGYLAFLAGALDGELFVYLVSPGGADLVAVDQDTGAERLLLGDLPPFARDFSVDAGRAVLVYRGRHETDSGLWTIEELDLLTGTAVRLYEEPTFALAPAVWPGGEVAYSPGLRGLQLLGRAWLQAPLGPGVDVVRSVSGSERFVALLHTVASELPVPFVFDRSTGAALLLPAPEGEQMDVAGFVEGGAP